MEERLFPELSLRREQIACLYAEGLSLREIADRLGIAASTVFNHKYLINATLGARTQLDFHLLVEKRKAERKAN